MSEPSLPVFVVGHSPARMFPREDRPSHCTAADLTAATRESVRGFLCAGSGMEAVIYNACDPGQLAARAIAHAQGDRRRAKHRGRGYSVATADHARTRGLQKLKLSAIGATINADSTGESEEMARSLTERISSIKIIFLVR
jgi:hypothetical protein